MQCANWDASAIEINKAQWLRLSSGLKMEGGQVIDVIVG